MPTSLRREHAARSRSSKATSATARRLPQAVAGCDYVFHQAAIRITLCAEQPRECIDVLVMGAFNVFEAAVAAGVKKVVYASSASVYGAAEIFPTDERHHPYQQPHALRRRQADERGDRP